MQVGWQVHLFCAAAILALIGEAVRASCLSVEVCSRLQLIALHARLDATQAHCHQLCLLRTMMESAHQYSVHFIHDICN